MPYTPWTDEPGKCEQCRICKQAHCESYGTMQKRRHSTDSETYSEYKIVCKLCKQATGAHRSKLITIKEWEGKQEPQDILPHRKDAK
jgi:hypothetical protein